MEYSIETTDYDDNWWHQLTESEQIDIDAAVTVLKVRGPLLPFPCSSGIEQSDYSHMRELRIQHKG